MLKNALRCKERNPTKVIQDKTLSKKKIQKIKDIYNSSNSGGVLVLIQKMLVVLVILPLVEIVATDKMMIRIRMVRDKARVRIKVTVSKVRTVRDRDKTVKVKDRIITDNKQGQNGPRDKGQGTEWTEQ